MTPQLIDAHAHVNFAAFDADLQAVIERALEAGYWHINVGTQKDTSQSAVNLANTYDEGVYAVIGLHPIHTSASYHDQAELGGEGPGFKSRGEVFDYEFYRELAQSQKVVGIGECGLDYFRPGEADRAAQQTAFKEQIRLASELGKPLMLHLRPGAGGPAYEEAASILKSESKVAGNAHFFAGTSEEARLFLDLGFTISFTGVITFTTDYDDLVKYVPLDRILVETDCPYVAPKPWRGKRNEPVYVAAVASRVAELKGMSVEQVATATMANTRRLFNI